MDDTNFRYLALKGPGDEKWLPPGYYDQRQAYIDLKFLAMGFSERYSTTQFCYSKGGDPVLFSRKLSTILNEPGRDVRPIVSSVAAWVQKDRDMNYHEATYFHHIYLLQYARNGSGGRTPQYSIAYVIEKGHPGEKVQTYVLFSSGYMITRYIASGAWSAMMQPDYMNNMMLLVDIDNNLYHVNADGRADILTHLARYEDRVREEAFRALFTKKELREMDQTNLRRCLFTEETQASLRTPVYDVIFAEGRNKA